MVHLRSAVILAFAFAVAAPQNLVAGSSSEAVSCGFARAVVIAEWAEKTCKGVRTTKLYSELRQKSSDPQSSRVQACIPKEKSAFETFVADLRKKTETAGKLLCDSIRKGQSEANTDIRLLQLSD